MSNLAKYFYGSTAVAAELLNTPAQIADISDSIGVALEPAFLSMFPNTFPFGGRLTAPAYGGTFTTYGTSVAPTNNVIGSAASTQYLSNGTYGLQGGIETRMNGVTAGVNATVITNRLWDGQDGVGTFDPSNVIGPSRATLNWGGLDRLLGTAFTLKGLFYGGAAPPSNLQLVVRRTSDSSIALGIGNIGAVPANGYSSIDVACTALTTAADGIYVNLRLPDNGTSVSLASLACIGLQARLTVPCWTWNSFGMGGAFFDTFADGTRFSAAAYSNMFNMLGITHARIHLGQNDLDTVTLPQFIAKIQTLIALCRQVNPNVGIFLCSQYQTQGSTPAKLANVAAAMQQVATSTPRVCFVDQYAQFPTYASNAVLLSDGTHPNAFGKYTFVSNQIATLREGISARVTGDSVPKLVNMPLYS